MQPLTLPEQRQVEQLIKGLKSGGLIIVVAFERTQAIKSEPFIKALEIALQTNVVLDKEWRKADTVA